jgi:hypothetical protein
MVKGAAKSSPANLDIHERTIRSRSVSSHRRLPLPTLLQGSGNCMTIEGPPSPVMCCAGLPNPRSSNAFAADTSRRWRGLGIGHDRYKGFNRLACRQ